MAAIPDSVLAMIDLYNIIAVYENWLDQGKVLTEKSMIWYCYVQQELSLLRLACNGEYVGSSKIWAIHMAIVHEASTPSCSRCGYGTGSLCPVYEHLLKAADIDDESIDDSEVEGELRKLVSKVKTRDLFVARIRWAQLRPQQIPCSWGGLLGTTLRDFPDLVSRKSYKRIYVRDFDDLDGVKRRLLGVSKL